ncbi:UvrD-helicase domain-containing protein [Buchnera aphidicola]|uniref:UvrD-helicase domain-containing protein n=1 Tax=Buchnera aphidicola TaxID=9 RepID=UPI003463DA04
MSLNYSQKKAINTINGPCLVLAGAGSGKTTVIISKIIQLISLKKYQLHEIFAITFTNKAAREMQHRIRKKICIKYYNSSLNISTFHALGMKIIRNELNVLKYRNNYSLFNYTDQLNIIKKIAYEKIQKNKNLFKKILIYISYQKNKLVSPEQAMKVSISNIDKEFSYYYYLYNQYLKKYHAFDFDDLIYVPIMLFKNHKSILLKWQNYIKYLLVDEYQDTSYIQYQFINLLTQNHQNFTLVGDDDQSIYSWRGAGVKNIFLLKHDYPKLKIIKMEHNYRSSKRILNAANHLISHNPHIIKKKLFSNFDDGKKISILYLENEYMEAEEVLKNILLHKSIYQNFYKDYAILYRNNYQSKIFEKIFLLKKIPYFIHNHSSFFSHPEIKYLIIYLRFIINQNDDSAFLKIINVPSRKIGKITINKIEKWAKKKNISYFNVILDKDFQKEINQSTNLRLLNFFNWIQEILEFAQKKPSELLNKIIYDIKYTKWLLKNFIKNKNIDCIKKNIVIFLNWIKNALNDYTKKSFENLLDIIIQLSYYDIDYNNNDISSDKIQLMTIHASKGLEFSSVFIIGMEEGILPYEKNLKNNIDEERRLMYVGITRAKKELTLSFCEKRYYFGKTLFNKPSRFLFELPSRDIFWKKLF